MSQLPIRRRSMLMRASRKSTASTSRLAACVGAAASLLACAPHALAQTWNGASATTSNWTDAANWAGGIAPVNNGTANVAFAGSARTSPVVNAVYDVNSVTFNFGAAAFAIGGAGPLTIRAGGIANNATQQMVFGTTLPLTLNVAQTWSATNGNIGINGAVTNSAALTVNVPTSRLMFFTGGISGSGSFIKNGGGTLNLSTVPLTYTGVTQLNDGITQVLSNNVLSDASDVQMGSGAATLAIANNSDDAIPSLSGAAGQVQILSTSTDLLINSNVATTFTFGGVISGGGRVAKSGAHTWELSGSNTFTGQFSIQGGTVRTIGAERLSNSLFIALSGGSVLHLGGAESIRNMQLGTGASIIGSGPLILSANASSSLLDGLISVPIEGLGSLAKAGGATVELAAPGSTYTGGTLVTDGVLIASAVNAISPFSPVDIAGGALRLTADHSIGHLSGFGGALELGGVTLTVGASNADTSYSGPIGEASGSTVSSLNKVGTGILALSGVNTYRGTTTVSAGTLTVFGDQRLLDSGELVISSGGTFRCANEQVLSLALNGGTLTRNQLNVGTFTTGTNSTSTGGVIDMPVNIPLLTKSGPGTLVLNYSNPGSAFKITGGVLQIASDPMLGSDGATTELAGGTLLMTAPMTLNRPVLCTGSAAVDCRGDVIMSDYSSDNASRMLIKRGPGTLSIASAALNGSSHTVEEGTLRLASNVSLPAEQVSTHAGGTLMIDGGLLRPNTGITNVGTITMNPGARITGGTLINSGIVEGDGVITSTLTNAVAGDVRVAANDLLRFTSTSAHANAGLIDVVGGAAEFTALVTNQVSTGLIFARNATLRFNGGLTNFGSVAISFGSTDVYGDVDNRAGATTTISGAANATFIDDVTNNGVLRTSTGGNTVFLGSVTGSGTFPGSGTVYLEGDLRPGNSPGVMDFGGVVSFGSFAALRQEIAGTNLTDYDRMTVANRVELDGTLDVQFIGGFNPGPLESYTIISAASRIGRFTTVNIPSSVPALQLRYTSTSVILTTCLADFNSDGGIDFFDYLDFVAAFSSNEITADFNLDESIDFFDYLDFVAAFSAGC